MRDLSYVNLNYEPSKDELIAEYYVEPAKGYSLKIAAANIAAESSIGTWTTIKTMNDRIAEKLKPHVYSINQRKKIVKIAYAPELFEMGNISQIFSSIAGNVFGMKLLNNLRLEDVRVPEKSLSKFPGPKYGINGVRKITKVKKRPLIGTIVKPKVGLTSAQHAKVAYESWVGGLDIVKDDENLSSLTFNRFKSRMEHVLKLRDKAERETGDKKIYIPNITSESLKMLERAKIVDQFGGEYVMVDILTSGWAGLQTVRNNVGKVIHAHRAMHAALTRNPKHGISMLTLAKFARLAGVDQLHIGTVVGKMHGGKHEVMGIRDEIEKSMVTENGHVLEENWKNIKPAFAVASGGLHPGLIPNVMKYLGNNIIMQFGGGCHGHPEGTRKGAVAIKQALESTIEGTDLREYAKTHKELASAIKKWGFSSPK